MQYFLTNLSKYLNYELKHKNHIFGDRYYPTIIRNKKHLINVIRYIYQNPIRANICYNVEDYKYSSLGFYSGLFNHGIQIDPQKW